MCRSPCGSVDWNKKERSWGKTICVAPLVGAWIEITMPPDKKTISLSLPLWERGLKYCPCISCGEDYMSLPLWERGLKFKFIRHISPSPLSLPLWERGLKYHSSSFLIIISTSLPLWERGLKYRKKEKEIYGRPSLPLWERGLKSPDNIILVVTPGRSPCGSVDWNLCF